MLWDCLVIRSDIGKEPDLIALKSFGGEIAYVTLRAPLDLSTFAMRFSDTLEWLIGSDYNRIVVDTIGLGQAELATLDTIVNWHQVDRPEVKMTLLP